VNEISVPCSGINYIFDVKTPINELLPALSVDIIAPSNHMKIHSSMLMAANETVLESLHLDPFDNMVSAVKGAMRITMFPPWRYSELYPGKHRKYLLLSTVSISHVDNTVLYVSHYLLF
jgi:hypothetical protein